MRMLLLAASLLLAGCSSPREVPSNSGAGTDEMRRSPCVCAPVPFDGGGYRWVG